MNLPNFDILSPIDTLIGMQTNGPMHRFTFVPNAPLTPLEVERLLRSYGIRVWGRKIVGPNRSLLVKKSQAVWAEYLMCRAGMTLITPLLDERNATYPDRHSDSSMPTPWTKDGIGPVSLIDYIGEFFDRIGL